jgi:hypothetical protein
VVYTGLTSSSGEGWASDKSSSTNDHQWKARGIGLCYPQESQDAEASEVGNQSCRNLKNHEEEQRDDVDRCSTNGGDFWKILNVSDVVS